MKTASWLPGLALLVPLALAGCKDSTADKGKAPDRTAAEKSNEADIHANLAMLEPDDRRLAEAQRFCAVEDENRLGSMGKPIKLTVKGEPVFLCCKGCQRKALADPERTIAKARELSAKNAAPPKK